MRGAHLRLSSEFHLVSAGQLLSLRTHQAVGAFGTQNVVMEIGDPLAAGYGHVQIFDPSLEMGGDLVPEKGRVFVDEVGRRRVAELAIPADLFEFEKQRVGFARVHGVPELADQIGGLHQLRLFVRGRGFCAGWWRKSRKFDRAGDAIGIDSGRTAEPLVGEEF